MSKYPIIPLYEDNPKITEMIIVHNQIHCLIENFFEESIQEILEVPHEINTFHFKFPTYIHSIPIMSLPIDTLQRMIEKEFKQIDSNNQLTYQFSLLPVGIYLKYIPNGQVEPPIVPINFTDIVKILTPDV